MKFLPHVERSIERHGYIKPECAPALAVLMEEMEGNHPHQIARAFRQRGTPLPKEAKKLLGIRANADMSNEAMDALTQKGLSEPLKGFEITLLDANFAYFRHRSMGSLSGSGIEQYATYYINSAWPDCSGCQRLDGRQIVAEELDSLPPRDCERDACALGIRPEIDYTKRGRDKYKQRIIQSQKKKGLLSRLFGR